MSNISVVIVAQNEERTIGEVLSQAKLLASEIIFVDSGSTDKTVEIARQYGVKYYHQDWLGYAKQKNYALGLAEGDWLLSLDADEIMTPDLVTEIQLLMERPEGFKYDGYQIPRILYIGEKAVKRGGFYPDAQLRLFKQGKGRFNHRLVHEAVKVDGPTSQLKYAIKHMAYRNIAEFQAAMETYARLSAQENASRENGNANVTQSVLDEVIHPQWTFFYRYIVRGGFLDGKLGFDLSCSYSGYVRNKIKYLREERSRFNQLKL